MIIKIVLLTLSTFSLLCGSTTIKKISSPQVGKLQAEYPKAESKRRKEIITTLTEGGFAHIADTLMISTEQEMNNNLKHTIFELEQTVAKLKQENSDFTAQLAQEKKKNENAIAAQEKKTEALNQEIRTLQESLKASDDQKAKTISVSSRELDETKQKLAQAEQKVKDLEAEKTALMQKNKNYEEKALSHEKELQSKQKELEASQKEMQQFKLEARAYFSELEQKLTACSSAPEQETLSTEEQINELDRKITALKTQLMADAVDQRRKDYATKTMKGISFDAAEKMVQSSINKEIQKLEKVRDALKK
jgi:chromosome segregation ATPase